MSGAQTSTFAPPNVLLNTLSGAQTAEVQQNQLMNQGRQLDLSNANMEQVARASAGLLSAYTDEASRAAAYPRVVGMLQANGFAMQAPAQYPGEGVLRSLAATQVPAADLYKLQQTKAALDAVWPNAPASTTVTPTTGTPGGGTGAQGQVPPLATAYGQGGPNNTQVPQDWLPYFQEASQRTGIPADVLIAQMRQESGFNPTLTGTSGEIGPAQVMPSTARAPGAGVAPVDPSMLRDPRTAINFQADYLKSRLPAGASPSDPVALNRALYGYNGGGDKDYVAHVTRYLPAPGGGTATAATAPAPTQYAGPGVPPAASTAPPGSTAAPAASPAAPAAPAPAPDTQWDLPGAPAPDQPAPPATTAAAPPGTTLSQPQPAATGSRVAPPPPPTVTVPPPVPLPPAPPPVDNRYLTAQDYQDLNRMKAGLVTNPNGAQLLQAEIDRRATTNVQRIQNYQTAQEKQRADAIAAQQLQLQGSTAALENWKAANPDAKITQVGGDIITQDPRTGAEIAPRIPVNANRADLAAALTVSRLGPKIAAADAGTGPPVTPEERAEYAVQAQVFQHPVLTEDPISRQKILVPERQLPPNFPQLGGGTGPAGARPVTQGLSPAQQEIERDPAAFEVNKRNYNDDATDIRALSASGRQLQSDQIRTQQMQNVLQGFTSGPGTEARTAAAAWFQRWLPAGLTGWEKEPPTLSGAAAAQEFQKLALGSAGAQDQALLGKNAGYRSLELFKTANPNSELLDPTNAHILDMQLVQNQASQDYIQAAQAHFKQQEQSFKTTHQYNSLNDFDADWGAQRNPQVYAAAMGAVGGQPASQWAKGLSNEEYARALQIVQRAKPSAVVQTKSGPYSMQPNAVTNGTTATPGTKVIRFDHNGNQIQ